MQTSEQVYANSDIVWVSVQWLMNNTHDSVDCYSLCYATGWQDMLSSKTRDTGFGHLVESIMKHGFTEDGSIGWDDGMITEGHHRLCAAILLVLDAVPISKYGRDSRHNISAHANDDGLPEFPMELEV